MAAAAFFTVHDDAHASTEYASWYGYELAGSPTATGEPFNPEGFTAASWEYALGTYLKVCYWATGACVVVRVNDRGPAAWTRNTLDLSLGAAEAIGLTWAGEGYVTATPIY